MLWVRQRLIFVLSVRLQNGLMPARFNPAIYSERLSLVIVSRRTMSLWLVLLALWEPLSHVLVLLDIRAVS